MTKSEFKELANLYDFDKNALKDELKTLYKKLSKEGVEPYAQFKKDGYKFKDLSSDAVMNLARLYFRQYEEETEETKEPVHAESDLNNQERTEERTEQKSDLQYQEELENLLNMKEKSLIDRLHAKDGMFDEDELKNLIDEYECDRVNGKNRRWTRTVSSIIKVENEYFSIDWEEGLTECQENSYMDQPVAVKPVEKQITVTEWVIDNDRLLQAEQKTEEPVQVPQNEEESVHSELDDEDEFDYDYE